jgi:ABC-type branched-subunit amino acid transport system substrate-binding protein
MNERISRFLAVFLTLSLMVAVGACGKAEDEESGGGGGEASGEVKTGPGVTADTISLAQITDLSGVFAPVATAFTQAQDMYFKQVNADGGVCGRQVKLVNKDAGYDVQKAVSLYRDVEPDVAAVSQLVGSPIIAALLPTLEKDSMLTMAAAWPPAFLDAEPIGIVGATYDIEAINGIEWMMENKGLKEGDKIGDLYFEGDFGEGGLIGVKHIAEQKGLEVVEQKIKATDEDMSSAVAAFKRAGVKAIWVTTGPAQLASLVGVAAAQKMNVPIGTNGPVFAPQLLDTPVGPALDELVTVFNGSATYASDNPEVAKVAAQYEKEYPKGVPQQAVLVGYGEAVVTHETLKKACDNKDLTREGIVKAFRELNAVDTKGLVAGDLDFSKVGQSSSKAVFAHDVDKASKGGLKTVGEQLNYESAQSYERAAE